MWLVVTHFMMNNKNIELNKQLHKKILFLLFFEWINGTFLVYFFLIPALLFSITGLKKSFILKRTQVNFKVAHFFLSFSLSLSRLQFTWVYWGFQVSCKKKKNFFSLIMPLTCICFSYLDLKTNFVIAWRFPLIWKIQKFLLEPWFMIDDVCV